MFEIQHYSRLVKCFSFRAPDMAAAKNAAGDSARATVEHLSPKIGNW